eukprot:gene3570-4084_t
MNRFITLLVAVLFVAAATACPGDYDPSRVTIGECAAADKAHYRETENAVVITPDQLSPADRAIHEGHMAYILNIARANTRRFVSSIVNPATNEILCIGMNTGLPNLISHGEIVAINNCSAIHGMRDFTNMTIYTTGEPCAMCASAILWANFKTVVWGTYNSDLLCKICMSNLPIDSSYIFGRYYGLRSTPPVVIGGVLRAESDAWFVTYCNRPTSIFYMKPQCACQNTTSPLTVTQTLANTWFDGNLVQWSQYNSVITNTATYQVTNPLFSAVGNTPSQIWGLKTTSVANQYSLAWNPIIHSGQTFNFGYIVQGADEINFSPEAGF